MSIDDEIASKQAHVEMFWRTDNPAVVLELIEMASDNEDGLPVRAVLVEIAALARSGIEAIDKKAEKS